MLFYETLRECILHLTYGSSLSDEEYKKVEKYLVDHKYYLDKEHSKDTRWDEVYNNFREYVYGPIRDAIRVSGLKEHLKKNRVELLIEYMNASESIAIWYAKDRWMYPDSKMVCYYILWQKYYESYRSRDRKMLDKYRAWYYSKKVPFVIAGKDM
jgi:hypothetical protein